jgi:hypothetical protein
MPTQSPTTVLIDNMAAMEFARNPTHRSHAKHIDVKLMASRRYIQERIIELSFVPTRDNLADILTKALPYHQFWYLADSIMGIHSDHYHYALGEHFPHEAFNKELDILFGNMEMLD